MGKLWVDNNPPIKFGVVNGPGSPSPKITSVDDMDPYKMLTPYVNADFTGDKFYGGFGTTQIFTPDYWTLRARSSQLFTENLYARGLIRRLVTNEINTGLTPEASPDEEIIGLPPDSLDDWTEDVENRFGLWAKNPLVCDYKRESTFGALQREIRREALVAGDILVVLVQNPVTRVPMVRLVSGNLVQTPFGENTALAAGNKVTHGVEQDRSGRVVAYWIQQDDGSSKRLPAFGPRTGRRVAWLVFGTDKRLDDLRGQPLLSLVLQSIKEVDRYRDSAQRKATVNSILAMFIKKSQDKQGTLPVQGSAIRNDRVTAASTATGDGRTFTISNQIPGVVMEELQTGEEPVGFHSQGTDINFPVFEAAILHAIAWAHEVPPEILTLAFSNNYSASQAAINEFKIYLNLVWSSFGETLCTRIYNEWLVSEVLNGSIVAPGFLEAWRDTRQHATFGAWVSVDWYGSIKPSTDMLKQARGSKMLVDEGWSTRARESRITTGTKFSKNIKRLKKENAQLAEALRPRLELEKEFGPQVTNNAIQALENATFELAEVVDKIGEN